MRTCSLKHYAFIQMTNENIDGVEHLKSRISTDNGNLEQFTFRYYQYLPQHLSDSFSRGFQDSAMILNQNILVIEAVK